jgi:hypothetical protein
MAIQKLKAMDLCQESVQQGLVPQGENMGGLGRRRGEEGRKKKGENVTEFRIPLGNPATSLDVSQKTPKDIR